jgi:hypothetical protein
MLSSVIDQLIALRHAFAVQMTEAFASAITVTVPILALAAGAEARAVRDRLRQPDAEWEHKFEEHQAAHEFDPARPPTEVLEYFKGVPGVSKAYVVDRVLAVCSAIVWLVVFVLLAITELLGLVWLGDGAAPGDSGLATFCVVTIGLALAALIMAPAVYLFVPVLLPFDLLPHGLKKAVVPKLVTKQGHGFVKVLLSELEGAIERAADKVEGKIEKEEETPAGPPTDGEPSRAD